MEAVLLGPVGSHRGGALFPGRGDFGVVLRGASAPHPAVVVQVGHQRRCADLNLLRPRFAGGLPIRSRDAAPGVFRDELIRILADGDAEALGELVKLIDDETISGKIAKDVFSEMMSGGGRPGEIVEKKGLKQVTDASAIEAMVDEVLAANPGQVENYRQADPAKQPKMIGFFVGQIMQRSQGKANPKQVNELLRKKLG